MRYNTPLRNPYARLALPLGVEALAGAQATSTLRAAPVNPSIHRFDEAYYVLEHNTYSHGNVTAALDAGLRAVELDVLDSGDWENHPDGPYVTHGPGLSGSPPRLGSYLRNIDNWLSARPGEGPIIVFVDMKTSTNPLGDWNAEEVYFLDRKVRDIVGARLYTADDLYRHATGATYAPGRKSLRQAVSEAGWPMLAALRGKILVAYTGGVLGRVNQTQGAGIEHIMRQPGRTLPYGFFCPDVESDPGELDPGGTVDGISRATSQFLVASNLKARDHYQITANRAHRHCQLIHLWGDHVYSNREFVYNYIAVAHGISVIGRDAAVTDTFGGALPLVGVRRSLPGYFELHPTHVPNKCLDVSGAGTRNGARVQLWQSVDVVNQRFVYTAESQLRPQHVNTHGVDIDGGRAGEGRRIHIWDCDGGNSEKWIIEPNGAFRSYDNRSYCLDVTGSGTANGTPLVTRRYNGGANQRFLLRPVPDWPQTRF